MRIYLFLFLLLPAKLYSQDTIFFNQNWKRVSVRDSAAFYRFIERNASDNNVVVERDFYINNNPKEIKSYSNYEKHEWDGIIKSYYENGKIKSEIAFTKGEHNGEFKTYWENGQLKRADKYEKGKFIEGKCYNDEGKEIEYFQYETMPYFGDKKSSEDAVIKYLIKNVKYPDDAIESNISGVVHVGFVIDKSGQVKDVKVIKSVYPTLDEEAMRVIRSMPKWTPGKQDGDLEDFNFVLPIRFALK